MSENKIKESMTVQATEKEAVTKPSKNGEKGQRKTTRTRLTQKAIVEAAATLFANNGFGATSLDDIATAMGVTKGALYYHIKNKEEILRLIFLTVLMVSEEPLRQIVESDAPPAEKLQRAVQHHTAVAANRSPAMTVFYREQNHLTGPFAREIILRKKNYERYFEQIIEEGVASGVFKSDTNSKIATFGLLGMCNWLSQWYKPDGELNHRQIADIFANLLENGLLAQSS